MGGSGGNTCENCVREGLYGRPSAIANAAAINGNGSDTAARSHTMRAGIIGTSQIISR